MTMSLVQTITVGSGGAASIEFTSIPQDADDLFVLFSTREATTTNGIITVKANNNAESNAKMLQGNGSSVASASAGAAVTSTSGTTANTFGNASAYFPNYSGSTAKTVSIDSVGEGNEVSTLQRISTALYSSTAAITSIKLEAVGGNIAQYSTASLYKITKA